MALSLADVEKIAVLSRVAINNDEKQKYLSDLNGIFEIIEKMKTIDTDNIIPLSHPHENAQRLREDVVVENKQRDQFQATAPQTENGLYLVPKVIE